MSSINVGSAILPKKRIANVGGDGEQGIRKARVEPVRADGRNAVKASPRGNKGVPVFIQKACAKRGDHTTAAIVGGTAAHREKDMAISEIQRRADQLAHAVGRGGGGGALLFGDQRQPCCGGHLDDGRFVFDAKHGLNGVHVRPRHRQGMTVLFIGKRRQRSFPAIRNGRGDHRKINPLCRHIQPFFNGRGGISCRNAPLKGIGSDDDLNALFHKP